MAQTAKTHGLGKSEQSLLAELRQLRRHVRAEAGVQPPPLTAGQKIADGVAAVMGSWPFIIGQSTILAIWIGLNVMAWVRQWDPYPFILLNLMLSFQAAYAAPFIMMSQNRQSDIDRIRSIADYQVNIRAKAEISLLHEKLDLLRERQVAELISLLKASLGRIEALENRILPNPPSVP